MIVFFKFGRFPAINELTVVPMGDVPRFVNSNDVISPSKLYEKVNSKNSRGLVFLYFLAALSIHWGGEKIIWKNAMREFYHTLSMQPLRKSNDNIFINFDAINWLNKNLNNLMIGEIHAFKKQNISTMLEDCDGPISVVNEQTYNKKIENNIDRYIINNWKTDFPTNTDHISLPNSAEKIKQQKWMSKTCF